MTSMFIMNTGSIFGILGYIMAGHIFLVLIKLLTPRRYRENRFFTILFRVKDFLEFSAYLMYLESVFYEIALALFLQYTNVSFSNVWNEISFGLTISTSIIYYGSFFVFYLLLRKNYRVLYSDPKQKVPKYFGYLIEGFNISRKSSRTFII